MTRVKKKMPSDELLEIYQDFLRWWDSTRIKILWALDESEMCVCDIANVLNMTKSAVSHQLETLEMQNL